MIPRAGETVTTEILIGMKLMVRRAPLFPLIWPLQWEINTDKDLKRVWYSASYRQSCKIRDPWNGASVLLYSASRPGWFPQTEKSWIGHTPHTDSPKSGHQHKDEHQCSSTLKVLPCVIPLCCLETENICWTEYPFQYSIARTPYMEIRSSNLCSY